VRYETAKAFRTALEQRLKNEAKASGVALIRLRKRVAFERFLARLVTSESNGWVLKGAFALELRLGLRTRTTKDIDLGQADDEETATEHLNAATDIDLGDFFDFEVRRMARTRWSLPRSQSCSYRSFRLSSTLPRSSTLIPAPLGMTSGRAPGSRIWSTSC
jgi:predicted nucleotidyltransferase component of viral defense system